MWQEQSGVNYLGLWCFTFAAQALCNGRRERHSGGRSSSSTGYSTAGSSTACPCCDQHNGSTLPGPSHEQSFSIFHFPPKSFLLFFECCTTVFNNLCKPLSGLSYSPACYFLPTRSSYNKQSPSLSSAFDSGRDPSGCTVQFLLQPCHADSCFSL